MLIENHQGIFVVDKRLRGLGDIRLPGDGISYTRLGWAAAGTVLGALPAAALFFLTSVASFVSGWATALLTIAPVLGGAMWMSYIGGRRGSDGRTASQRLFARLRYMAGSKVVLDGQPFKPGRKTISIDGIVAQAE